jgi:hypothetical protein
VAASPTGDTAFVGVLALPSGFHVGGDNSYRSLIPTSSASDASASWARELAFRSVVPAALTAPASFAIGGKSSSEADLGTALGAVDKKKKESFRIGDTSFADTKSVVAALKDAPSGDVSVERLTGDSVSATTIVSVQQAADIPPTLDELISSTLGSGWTTSASPGGDLVKVLVSSADRSFDVDIPGTMIVNGGAAGWSLAKPGLRDKVLSTIAASAVSAGVGVSAGFPGKESDFGGDVLRSVQEALLTLTAPLSSLDAFLSWQKEFGDALYIELAHGFTGVPKSTIAASWRSPKADSLRSAWQRWLKANPGMVRLEVSVRGFFTNGGSMAYPSFYLSAAGASAMAKGEFLGHAYDDFSRVAMVCSPGLSKDWQAAVLTYCGPLGRRDLFAVLDTPRYFLTQPTTTDARSRVGSLRWSDQYKAGDDPNFEVQSLETIGAPSVSELRFRAMTDTLLSEVVPRDEPGHGGAYAPWVVTENPATTGLGDRYIVAPPSGFVAGLIAATDDKPGAGVHKAPANEQLAGVNGLVALIGDKDQARSTCAASTSSGRARTRASGCGARAPSLRIPSGSTSTSAGCS